MTRPQVLEKLGEPRRRDAQGWEDFGTVQILWSEEPQKSILGMRGHQLLDLQEVVATVGDPLQKVIDRLGLPQELHSDKTGERHLLNYVPNNIRVVAVGKDPAEMGTWRIEQLNWSWACGSLGPSLLETISLRHSWGRWVDEDTDEVEYPT